MTDVATTEKPATEGSQLQFLTFTIGREEYGVDIMKVREIKAWSDTTRLPNAPDYMRGVMNLRGLIIPIFDLRCRFGMGLTEANEKNVVIILAVGTRTIGILVDTVSDILTAHAGEIKPAPKMDTVNDEYLNGLISLEERMVALLDVDYLFDHEMLEAATHTAVKTQTA
jgi:purine-binding chemotaxis protein CheW